MALLDRHNCRGFSYWQQVQGRGSVKGEPHYGSDALHALDVETPQLGLRAFVWNIEQTI